MRVSYPELYTHCKKVLEACGLPLGYVEEGAEMVAWEEFSGRFGLKKLVEELDFLQASNPSLIRITSEDARLTSVDGGGQSSLLCGRIAVDLAFAKATEMRVGVVHVNHCRCSDFLIQNAARIGMRGMACAIHWMDEYSNNWAVAFPNQKQPSIIKEALSKRIEAKQTESVLVICADTASMNLLMNPIPWNEKQKNISVYSPEDIQARWDLASKQGKEVDSTIWKRLDQVGSQVLVESTELSRVKGAGEAAN